MATLITQSSTFIAPNDPIFNQPEQCYDAVVYDNDFKPAVSERYQYLDERVKQTILTLWEARHEAPAQALADCGKHGSVHAACTEKNAARAHRHTCHLWIDPYCGKPSNLLHCWLRWRSPETRTLKQWGIEIRGPLGSQMMDRASKIARWLKDQGVSCTFRPVIEPKPRFDAVRMVIRKDKSPFVDIKDYLHKITKHATGYSTFSFFDASPVRVLEWMFKSTESVLQACGHTRARLYLQWFKKQMTRTSGDFYKEIEEEQFDRDQYIEEDETAPADLLCNCGKCSGVMQVIPWQERRTQAVEEIIKEYKRVDWTSCYDPFRNRRIEHKGPLMADSATAMVNEAMPTHSPPI